MAAKRSKYEVERDRQIVSEYYLKGHSSRSIAGIVMEKVGKGYSVSHTTISGDIKALLKQWQKERINDIDKVKAVELEKLDKLEQTYWDAWEKSIQDYKRTSLKQKGTTSSSRPEYREQTTMEMISHGNPAYLAGVERCIERRCKILGIDAPQKIDATTKGESLNTPFMQMLKAASTIQKDGDGN